jgi:hypothetical protein
LNVHKRSVLGPHLTVNCDAGLKCFLLPFFTNANAELDKYLSNKCLLFIDETNPFLNFENVSELIEKSQSYFIIVKRFLNKNEAQQQGSKTIGKGFTIPFSSESVLTVKQSAREHRTARLVDFNRNFYKQPDIILVEDSKGGYDFYRKIFKYCPVKVELYKGKDKIDAILYEYILNNKNILVIFDGCGVEQTLLMNHALLTNSNVQCFAEESLEWIFLNSRMFKEYVDFQELRDELLISVNFEELLFKKMHDITFGHRCIYKKNLSECYFKNCCIGGKPCDFLTSGTKLEILFESYISKFPFLIDADMPKFTNH